MDLRRRIERHIRASGITPTRLGKEAANDEHLVFDLRAGREIGPRLSERVAAWLDSREVAR